MLWQRPHGFSFTLESFAKLYIDVNRVAVDHKEFAKRMWGDVYYHSDTRTFTKKPAQSGGERDACAVYSRTSV